VVLEPNLALDDGELIPATDSALTAAPSGLRTAIFAARLIPWKGLLLAIESLRYAPNWRLVVLGDGPERERAREHAIKLGLDERVAFLGRVPRANALAAFAQADAMLFPSFHDSAPWAVGEASALGCPVVCIDAGGPPVMAGRNANVVPVRPSRTLAVRIGARLEQIVDRGVPEKAWRSDRLPGLLATWYGAT
jgi:glycosyltransferase involved in cell wall biosynthesis